MGAATASLAALGRLAYRARPAGELPIVVSIDVEPDGRAIDPRSPGGWDGFNELLRVMPALRERVSAATGAPAAFTWCLRMDPQIEAGWGSATWVAEAYADELAGLEAEGDSLALHTHDWRWNTEHQDWTALNEDPAWDEHCVGMALESFRRAFARTATTHRGGDHYLSAAMLEVLRREGVEVDLTVEPGLPAQDTFREGEVMLGASPDYRSIPTEPYRSSTATFPMPDPEAVEGPLLMPLFSAPGRRERTPLPLWKPPGRFAARLAAQLVRSPPPVLAFAIRVNIALDPRWEAITANLANLARHRGTTFVTAGSAAAAL